jgi:aryl-alcohol dehydrogenase-like predicted oxidoreductase
MEQRRLGRTGHVSSVVAFGAAALSRADQPAADRAIQLALDAGVNQIDVAPRYGDAELRLAPWMPRIRDRVFLNCKTAARTRAEARADLERSLERLGVERIDLYQLHSVGKLDDLNAATGPGGALETLVEARAQGLVRWLGVTGHTHDAPASHREALRRFDFDTVMFPLNPVLWAIPEFRRDAEALLDECRARDIGVHIIKSAARAPWPEQGERRYTTWYEPWDEQARIDAAVAFVLAQPGVTTICSAGDVTILPMVLAAAERARGMDAVAQAEAVAQAAAGGGTTPFVGRWA